MTRKIIHVDMDAFFAAVEVRDHPELKGRPVVVGGDPKSRSVVSAASYEARRYGIHSAMSCAKAYRLCPEAIFIEPRIGRYVEVSRQIREIFYSVTPLVEPLSLDEAYLDVTENLLGEPLARKLAEHIKKRIRDELHLTASAGVGPNKFIAKVASDLRKPDGLVVVPPQKVAHFVAKLPVERLWGVGPVTAEKLHSMGIFTTADIRASSVAELEAALGSFASFLFGLAHGEDPREVETESESKSCGSETTLDRDTTNLEELSELVEELARGVAAELKEMGRPGKTITLKLKYADFTSITRSHTIPLHTDDAPTIAGIAIRLLQEKTEAAIRPVRLVGVSVSGLLTDDEWVQLWLDFPPHFLGLSSPPRKA